ncbi:hypothetical protein N402_06525 [Helicobacter pylori FD423]|nr:hypothetical protein N402_06525 [Helicobacter pylori FD423]
MFLAFLEFLIGITQFKKGILMAYRFKILFDDKTHFLSLIFKFISLRG